MSSSEKFERDFEAFLKQDGDSELAALYRKLPRPEPDAKLDAAVLAMAHRALNPQLVATPSATHPSPVRRRARWLPVLSAVATAVFAIGVAVKMGPQWAERSAAPASAPGAAARDDGVVHVRTVDAPVPPPPPVSPPPPAAANAQAVAPPPRQEAARAALKPTAPPPPMPAPAPRNNVPAAEPLLQADADLRRKELEKAQIGAARAVAPQAFPAQPARAPEMDAVERKQAIAEGAWQRLHDNNAAGAAAAESTARAATAPAPRSGAPAAPAAAFEEQRAPAAVAAPAAAAPADSGAGQKKDAVEPTPAAFGDADAKTSAAAAPPARDRALGVSGKLSQDKAKREAPARAYSAETLRNSQLYPESWVAAIRRLIHAGRRDDARENLQLFREKYPDYHLPEDVERFARQAK